MLDYAEQHLSGTTPEGQHYLQAYVNDIDPEFEALVRSRGYQRSADSDRPTSMLRLPDPFPEIRLPEGYQLKSLQEENNLQKINRVLWRGFNHPGELPEDGIEGRRKMQSAEEFRKDLNMVVAAPDGNFVAYAGLWLDPVNRIAVVEPVATDPAFRRLGLGKAAVLEGIRRCGELGAAVAYVGSDQEFYRAMGFEKIYTSRCWMKYLPE
jgi:predicted N-acetyltransferase YhbS